jgi:uncharacterized membrane protein
MKLSWFSLYTLTLALWVGGMALFTFIVTPVIFKSFGRDLAGEIVGKLFPGYFLYTLVLSAMALIAFFLIESDRSGAVYRVSLVLLTAALIVNAYVTFKLHPGMVRIKQEVASFEKTSRDADAKKRFARLHAVSAALNLFILADGTVLLLLGPLVKK